MKIILTGASGLIGSRFSALLSHKHEIIPVSSNDVAISQISSVFEFFHDKEADVVIHLAAKTDVDACEEDRRMDQEIIQRTTGTQWEMEQMQWDQEEWGGVHSAFLVNFIGAKNVYEAAKEKGMKFVYISTDFIFPGQGEYTEESEPDPINWYGMTKYYGERVIDRGEDLIVRLSFPYGYPNSVKKDFVQKLIGLLKENDEVRLVEDQTITPTFIDDVVYGLDFLLEGEKVGIFHLTGSSFENPYTIGQKIKKEFGLSTIINTTTRENLYKGRAQRPFQSIMKNDKLKHTGFIPRTFDEGLSQIINS